MIKVYTKTLLGDEARLALMRGIKAVYDPVVATIGAKGRNSIYRFFGFPKVTNDGVSIANEVSPEDEFESMGADLIKDVARKTVRDAGDGTTTSIVLANALAEQSMMNSTPPMELQSELEFAKNEAIKILKSMSVPIKSREDILNVVKVSVEDDEMAEVVTNAVERAGEHGAIIVEEGAGYTTEVEEVKGYHWDRGYVSPYMITNPQKDEAILEDVPVIVTDRHMNLNKDLMQTLNELVQAGHKSALIIVDAMEGELLQSIIVNKIKGQFVAVVVRRPSMDEELEDIATLVNGTACTKDKGIKQINYSHTGTAKKVIVSKERTIILGEDSPALKQRIEDIKNSINVLKEKEEKEPLVSRLAKLSDGMIMIRVGAKTDAERSYKKDKLDDAVSAAKASQAEGIIAGGGAALVEIADALSDIETNGAEILRNALEKPYESILINAGIEPDGKFYNVKTGKVVKDMIKEGIIDPTKVARSAIENSVSFAKTFLTTQSLIAKFQEKDVLSELASSLGARQN